MAVIPYKPKSGKTIPKLYLYEETGEFYFVGWVSVMSVDETRNLSKTMKRALGTTDFQEAKRLLPEKEVDLRREIQAEDIEAQKIEREKAKPPVLIRDFFKSMRAEKKDVYEIADSTITRLDNVWKYSLEPFWGNLGPEHVTQAKVSEFVTWHKEHRRGIQFVNVFKYLGNIFSHMHSRDAIARSQIPLLILPGSEVKHHDRKKWRILTDAEYAALKRVASLRMQFMIIMARRRGMRQMEIGSLHKKQIRKIDGIFYIFLGEEGTADTKTRKERAVPAPAEAVPLLEDLLSGCAGYLFPKVSNPKEHIPPQMIDKEWQETKKKAGIKGRLKFHDLRHSAVHEFKRLKLGMEVACSILGMSYATYEKEYADMDTRDLMEELRRVGEVLL